MEVICLQNEAFYQLIEDVVERIKEKQQRIQDKWVSSQRAMEILNGLENVKRGVYGGAVGWFGFDGMMDTCIAIRTIVFKDKKAYIQAGAGIVADSVPESEYEECMRKARGQLSALEKALKGDF